MEVEGHLPGIGDPETGPLQQDLSDHVDKPCWCAIQRRSRLDDKGSADSRLT